jgi:rubrerythrin
MKEPLGPVEALKLALEKEVEACNIYQKFSIESKMLEVRDIFMFLSDEERKHQKLIENKIKEITKY